MQPKPGMEVPAQWLRFTRAAVGNAIAGRKPGELPPLDLSSGTDFQRSVWWTLLRIPIGEAQTYGEIAEAIGNPLAVRAVGRACGANPIPLLIPCHRVLAANSRLGGFTSGLAWKKKLLRREGIQFVERGFR